jgi:hypothetical protein
MDISKFKDLIQRLHFLGNYSSLILPVVIILIAVLLFIPTQLMSSKLKERIESESVSIGRRIQSLNENTVPRNQWKVEQDYQKLFQRDANQTLVLAKQSSQRPLLSYKIFPEPKDTSVLIFKEFGRRYRSAIDKLIVNVNALDCPTVAELQKGLQGYSSPFSSLVPERRRDENLRMDEVDATIMDVLCCEKAKRASVYANPVELSGYEFWEKYEYTGMDTAVEDCWYWQLAYWVIEDVIDTIDVLNSGSNSVLTSPVKRLLSVNFAMGDMGKAAERTAVEPTYVLSFEKERIRPHTGRFCNDDIDVVHFNLAVVVSNKAVLPFMQQLCSAKQHKFRGFSGNETEQVFKHNQITILESNIRSIDRANAAHNLYRYGEDAVVELDLVCEYIFDKIGLDEIKPESVKKSLMAE